MKSTKYVKNYFKKRGTVSKWWNPTKGDYAYLFEYQLNKISSWLSKERKGCALEVSCGKGRGTKKLNKLFGKYLATDLSKEMLSISKKGCPNVKFQKEDAEDLSIKSETQDVVICLAAIVHYPNPQKALDEFYRVLKPGRVLVFDSDNSASLRRIVKRVYRFFEGNKFVFGGDIFQPYSKKQIKNMLKGAGFKIEKFKYVGTISPIECHKKDKKSRIIIGVKVAKLFHKLGIDKIPIINWLATYHLILARKPDKN